VKHRLAQVGISVDEQKAAVTKQPVKLRPDADVLAALRASGDG